MSRAKKLTQPATAARTSAGVSFAANLTFENVCHHFGSKEILCGIDLVAEAGGILCLLGPSGSGKTTLLRIAAGIERQSEGRLLLNGREMAGPGVFVPPELRGVGLMFQDYALFPHMTLLKNVAFGLSGLSQAAARRAAGSALERVGLSNRGDQYPHMLSGGEQQRVALARALAPRPSVLLMDEPFSGLDSRLKDVIRTDTLQILRETRATAIVVTHDAEEAMRMGDKIALLRGGRLVQTGTGAELYRNPVDLFTAGFFSELNVIPAEASGGRVITALGPVGETALCDGTKLTVALRLMGLRLGESEAGVLGRIVSRRFLGGVELFTVVVEGIDEPLRSRMRAGVVPDDCRDVVVSIDAQDVIIFEKDVGGR
ncbi:ABC transporter ATP-binding protein [Fulvimarina sp. 2208YS6-2-32]|uniref:ABC transporter ATP-binding protein n=1 Tax=Fulvimarina uroteuthidis TaxID=3098149 RepID=A0ABU5I716_9HYPH|nr:ABC transporter ATP-binding protein [Fulvimarina sp. 2208YS6-2-32]MDY8110604.1 ABC transporter ATP-binding protein [Fulvimarina sp. 2208YS6-2-32]